MDAAVQVGDVPGPPVLHDGYVWALTFGGALVRVDVQALKLAGRQALKGFDTEGESLAAGFGSLWIRARDTVVRLNSVER